jgi:hypothetical protein
METSIRDCFSFERLSPVFLAMMNRNPILFLVVTISLALCLFSTFSHCIAKMVLPLPFSAPVFHTVLSWFGSLSLLV